MKLSYQEDAELIIYAEDFQNFEEWLNLNLEEVTWQGRFKKEFIDFWNIFFLEGSSLSQMIDRFTYAIEVIKIGPLSTWFKWLRNKFICFVFINKDITIKELALKSKMSSSLISSILRDFFVGKFPNLEEEINENLKVGSILDKNLNANYDSLASQLNINSSFQGNVEGDVMENLEVTLYDEWKLFLGKIKKELLNDKIDLKKLKENASLKNYRRTVLEVIVLFSIGVGLIFFTLNLNRNLEDILLEKISIFEPEFLQIDDSLKFKEVSEVESTIKLNEKEIEKIEAEEKKENVVEIFEEEKRFETESELILTSVNALPKDFSSADYVQSEYEETQKRGFRGRGYGYGKVFRVLLTTSDINDFKYKAQDILKNYNTEPIGNVKPGTKIPGGIYYNLHVPRKFLKEFLTSLSSLEEARVFESRSRKAIVPGMDKVFIWVKSL